MKNPFKLLAALFAPKAAIFQGAQSFSMLNDWIMSPLSPDREIRNELVRIRTRGRDLAKNSPIIQQYLTLLADNVIGSSGIKLQGQVRMANGTLFTTENEQLEDQWEGWSRTVSVCGRMTLTQFSHLVLRTVAVDGECFVRKVYGRQFNMGYGLQIIDADLVDETMNDLLSNGNTISMGIELDQWGRMQAIHVWTSYGDEIGRPRNRQRIPAEEIIHLFDPQRGRQSRGTSWLNSVMVPIKMMDGFLEAELIASRCAAAKMGFFEQVDPNNPPPSPLKTYSVEANPGVSEILPPGLTFKQWDPQHPNAAFKDFHKAVTRIIATGLKVSYNALANDLEGVNYSSIRSGLLIERDHWRVLQQWWIDRFLSPVLEGWQKSPLVILRRSAAVKWVPRGWAWVDPLKDVNAAILAIDNRLSSRTDIIAEKGGDIEDVFEQQAEEEKLAAQYGLDITPSSRALGPAPTEPNPNQPDPNNPPPQDPPVPTPDDLRKAA